MPEGRPSRRSESQVTQNHEYLTFGKKSGPRPASDVSFFDFFRPSIMAVCQNQRRICPFTVGVCEKCREELLKRSYRWCSHLLGLCFLRKTCVVQKQPSMVFLAETGSPPDPQEIMQKRRITSICNFPGVGGRAG